MSNGIDWDSHSFDERVGCLGFLLLVPAHLIAAASHAFVVRLVWSWYPPFGLPTPTFMQMLALLFLVAWVVRGLGSSTNPRWTNHKWFDTTVRPMLQPWMALGMFMLLRWLAS